MDATLHDSALVAAFTVQFARYTVAAVYTLTIYDWLLTIADEYELIIRARWTLMKAAYLICRYYPLLVFPFYIWAWCRNHSTETCANIVYPLYGMYSVFTLSSQSVCFLRARAFTDLKGIALVLSYTVCAAAAGAQIWLFGTQFGLVDILYTLVGDSGCFANVANVQLSGSRFTATSAGIVFLASFLFDLMIFLVVLARAFQLQCPQGSLGSLFIGQGFITFCFMSSLNLLTATIYLRNDRQFDGIALPLMLISDVLACRFIIDLRRHTSPTPSQLSILQSQLVRNAFSESQRTECHLLSV